jgi:hypothetical protein
VLAPCGPSGATRQETINAGDTSPRI